jgi:hypothetical protein
MTAPRWHWRSYGDQSPPTPAEALGEPLRAFPSWFLRIECERCGKVVMVNELPDMTPEEYKRRGDTADALWREIVRPGGR